MKLLPFRRRQKGSPIVPESMREFIAGAIDYGIKVTYRDRVITRDNIGSFTDRQLKNLIMHDVQLRQQGDRS